MQVPTVLCPLCRVLQHKMSKFLARITYQLRMQVSLPVQGDMPCTHLRYADSHCQWYPSSACGHMLLQLE